MTASRPPMPDPAGQAETLLAPSMPMDDERIGAPAGTNDDLQASLSTQQIECFARALEAAPGVNRRSQFFVWSQSQIFPLLPHDLLVCGAYQRQRRAIHFEVFQGVVVPRETLAPLGDGHSPLMRVVLERWVEGRGSALLLGPRDFAGEALDQLHQLKQDAGVQQLLVHGVARPLRPGEVESLFVFTSNRFDGGPVAARLRQTADLLIPFLHSTWCRVQSTEFAMSGPMPLMFENRLPAQPPSSAAASGDGARALTSRERQILQWAREGKSNPQIGEALGISPLTVKNHIQNILRKLGASNRAHAVALAMAQDLLGRPASRS